MADPGLTDHDVVDADAALVGPVREPPRQLERLGRALLYIGAALAGVLVLLPLGLIALMLFGLGASDQLFGHATAMHDRVAWLGLAGAILATVLVFTVALALSLRGGRIAGVMVGVGGSLVLLLGLAGLLSASSSAPVLTIASGALGVTGTVLVAGVVLSAVARGGHSTQGRPAASAP
jgi:hypothetical protein